MEYADVFGNYYGTSTEGVNALAAAGYDVILEIDVQGAAQVRNALPEAVGIFILPPSFDVLAARLKGAGRTVGKLSKGGCRRQGMKSNSPYCSTLSWSMTTWRRRRGFASYCECLPSEKVAATGIYCRFVGKFLKTAKISGFPI